MANKRISELALRTPQVTDLMLIGDPTTGYSYKATLSSILANNVPYSGATTNVNLGEFGISSGYIVLDTTPTGTPTGVGTISWDSFYGTPQIKLAGGNVSLQLGQEQVTLVHNNTGSTLTDGQVVYITGSTGELPTVALASNTSEMTSSVTFGVVTESIPHGSNGFITTSGMVHGLNTNAFTEGVAIWLGTGGAFTQTKPVAPANSVLIGYVVKKSGGNGSIFVKIQNGYELEELHNVSAQSPSNNDILQYKTSTGLWTKVAGTTSNIAEGTNLYYTDSRARGSVSLTTTGDSGAASYNSSTGVLNIPNYTPAVSTNYIAKATSMGVLGSSQIYDNGTSVLINTTSDNGSGAKLQVTGAATISADGSTSPALSVVNLGTGTTNSTGLFVRAGANTAANYIANFQNYSGNSVFYLNGAGAATFSSSVTAANAVFSGTSSEPLRVERIIGSTVYGKYSLAISGAGAFSVYDAIAGNDRFIISSTGAATFSSSVTAVGNITVSTSSAPSLFLTNSAIGSKNYRLVSKDDGLFAIQNTGIADLFYLNASGNVGIGVTPSAWSSSAKVLEIGALGNYIASGGSDTWIGNNNYYNSSGQFIYANSSRLATIYSQSSGQHAWFTAPSGTAGNAITFTQAMTLDASGMLLINTTTARTRLTLLSADAPTAPILGTASGHAIFGNGASNVDYGLMIGVNGDGNSWLQSQRVDGTATAYSLLLNPSGGNVGIGTTSPANYANYITQTINGTNGAIVQLQSSGTASLRLIGEGVDSYIDNVSSGALIFRTTVSSSERMRITSGGDLLVGKTSNTWTVVGLQTENNGRKLGITSNNSDNNLFLRKNDITGVVTQFFYNGTSVGDISISTTATTYNTSSDYRLKTDLKDFAGIDIVNLMKVYDYQWLSDSSRSYGVLAHELQSVLPYAVTGEKDGEMMQGVDYSKIVPVLVKAIQELNNKISKL